MKITITDDFDLNKIAYSGQCFRVRQLGENTFRFITGEHIVTITNLDNGHHQNNPNHSLEVSCDSHEWQSIWHKYFDLTTDYSKIRALIPERDRFLRDASDLGSGIRILKQNKFEMLISFIISQRKSIPAIKKSVEALCDLYGRKIIAAESGETISTFPTPKSLSEASDSDLQKCGLGYRIPYVKQAAYRIATGDVNLDLLDSFSDEDLINTLKSFYGVGDKVANCIALFAYNRLDLAPVDTWIKKVINTKYNGVNPFPEYGEYAGVMQQYMFFAAQYLKIT